MPTNQPLRQPDLYQTQQIVNYALREDMGKGGDVTSSLLIPDAAQARMQFVARERMVVCGVEVVPLVFSTLTATTETRINVQDGDTVEAGAVLVTVQGNARAILTGERVALNLLQRMSAVATNTARYVAAIAGTKAGLLDTRKTMPCLRELDKFAVRAGGGWNHRMRLDDMILIKDNHIALCGGIAKAVQRARAGSSGQTIEVECDTLEQVREALEAEADRIMLDNMDLDMLKRAVAMVKGRVPLEASGGVTLATIRAIAETGVDFISVGALTHSAPNVDIGGDITLENDRI